MTIATVLVVIISSHGRLENFYCAAVPSEAVSLSNVKGSTNPAEMIIKHLLPVRRNGNSRLSMLVVNVGWLCC